MLPISQLWCADSLAYHYDLEIAVSCSACKKLKRQDVKEFYIAAGDTSNFS